MELLPNNCRAGKFGVHPKNWQTKQADPKIKWCLTYWFYDDNTDRRTQVRKRGMNIGTTLSEKQSLTKALMAHEMLEIRDRGYNPITRQYVRDESEMNPYTPFVVAIEQARVKLKITHDFSLSIKSTVKYMSWAAQKLRIDRLPIKDISRKHIRKILDYLSEYKTVNKKKSWSANQHNAYLRDLRMIFIELNELEAMDHIPVDLIKKKKVVKKIRKVMSLEDRQRINNELILHYPEFWRLIHIFFHSGARTTELFRVQGKHVDLIKQEVQYLILKGTTPSWVVRPIKDIALPYWKSIMKDCEPEDFVFSEGLKPGAKRISSKQVSRRWRLHIKERLGILEDWYSLKFLHTTQVVNLLSNKAAAKINAHTSTAMVDNIYDLEKGKRDMDDLKGLANEF